MSVAVCMIVRNEAHHLKACLQSVQGVVDEIVVVDTGSQDQTKAIAQQCGARVFDFVWQDDFAAARNESLRHATSDWILYLDADERLRSEDKQLFLHLLSDKETVAYYVNVASKLAGSEPMAVHVGQYPRLFRNFPGVRFQGRIHEQIIDSLKTTGKPIKNCALTIQHLGYSNSEELTRKYARNLKLLNRQITEEPDNAFAHYCLGNLYDMMGKTDLAIELCQKAVAKNSSLLKAHFLLANNLMKKGQLHQARQAYLAARALAPSVPEIYYNLAVISIKQKDYRSAIEFFRDLMKINPDYLNVSRKIAACYIKLGVRVQ